MQFSTSLFTYSKRTKRFITEASNFGRNMYDVTSFCHRIYPDACDIGITLVSERTGQQVDYFHDETRKDDEGDILEWNFKPTPESIRRVPLARGTSVTVFND